jgi:hypothetical protein
MTTTSAGAGLGADVAGALQRAGQSLGIVDVHLAAEGAHLVGARATVGGDGGDEGAMSVGWRTERS